MEAQKTLAKEDHNLTMKSCREMKLTGIREVKSFDENEIEMDSVCGRLVIRGEALHVTSLILEKGEASLDGTIREIQYSDKTFPGKSGQSLLSRMFR